MGKVQKNRILVDNQGDKINKKLTLLIFVLIFITGILFITTRDDKKIKLYWFIPDGMRAEPVTFNIFKWAEEGYLPNIKRMMEEGSYGFSMPVYPSHTPVNFATLFTGTYPAKHGVSDGPMHEEGNPLNKVSVGGFSSAAKKIEPIWLTMEKQNMRVTLLSVPGSTPPELETGNTIVGRWGGWGASFHAVNFEELGKGKKKYNKGSGSKLFFFGPPLTKFQASYKTDKYPEIITTYNVPRLIEMTAWGNTSYGYIYDSTNDDIENYDRIAFSLDKKTIIADLTKGQWSNWLPIKVTWTNKKNNVSVNIDTSFKIKVTKLESDGFYVIRFYYNALNETLTKPRALADEITDSVGPMVDFVDNFPPQLIYYSEDKQTFLEEAEMSFAWHKKAVSFILDTYKPDVFIHDIYTPNQMLTSRWWLGYIDPDSPLYSSVTEADREKLWAEIKKMYKQLDDIIGVYLNKKDKNTLFVLSSDHGATFLHSWVHLNNHFARKGWLKFKIDKDTGEEKIDWRKSKVVYLKFDHIYVNPKGLHDENGKWYRGSGKEYEQLREEVINDLKKLKNNAGSKPLAEITTWENVDKVFKLPHDRCGDLIIANIEGFGWNEQLTRDLKVFSKPLKTGYKQSIIPENTPAMWTPFVIVGPGVKKGVYIGDKPINSVDQYPTIMKLLNLRPHDDVDGIPIDLILEN